MGNVLIKKNLPFEKDEQGFLKHTEFEKQVLTAFDDDDDDEDLVFYVFACERGAINV